MKNFMRMFYNIDTSGVLLDLKRQPDLWREDTYLRDYPQGPFGQVESVILRFPEKRVFEQQADLEKYSRGEGPFDLHECIDYPAYKHFPDARMMVRRLMNEVNGERLGRIMINKIKPGGRIFPHKDTPIHAEYWDRFHFVIESYPGVDFRAGDEHVYMAAGECWWFQNQEEHEVINNSAGDRIHMVVDVRLQR